MFSKIISRFISTFFTGICVGMCCIIFLLFLFDRHFKDGSFLWIPLLAFNIVACIGFCFVFAVIAELLKLKIENKTTGQLLDIFLPMLVMPFGILFLILLISGAGENNFYFFLILVSSVYCTSASALYTFIKRLTGEFRAAPRDQELHLSGNK